MILVLFLVWEDAKIWGHWSSSWGMHLNYLWPIYSKHWIPYPVFSILNSLLGCTTLLVGNCSGLWFNPLNIWMMRDTLCSFFFLTVSRHSYFVNTFQYLAVVYNGLKKLSHFIDLFSNILTTLALQKLFYLLGFSCISCTTACMYTS